MRKNSPSLAPGAPAYNATIYVVLDDFGDLGRAYAETDEGEADEKTVIENMIAGQYASPVRVVAFNTEEGWARDVSDDVARAVTEKLQKEGRAPADGLQRFLQRLDLPV